MVRVLIADDHKSVRDNLRSVLNQQQPQWEISEACNGEEAVDVFRKAAPDVAVLDIVMMPVGGVAAAYEMRRIDPKAKIILISGHYAPGDASIITRLLGAGAFVPKSEAVRQLVPTIQRVLSEENPIPETPIV
jgi:two-component system, NarL family, invasion response regulator UvrY